MGSLSGLKPVLYAMAGSACGEVVVVVGEQSRSRAADIGM
jgi:hypothetical protein